MKRQRKAFSMLTAIVVTILMATIGAFVLNLSGKTVKNTTLQYQREQAELYAKSYTEFAILAITGNDRTINCLQTITGTIGNYRIRTHIAYIVNNTYVYTAKCDGVRVLSSNVQTAKTPLTVMIDAYVDYQDLDSGQNHTVHRRTVQKI